jgi:hypothetical protein
VARRISWTNDEEFDHYERLSSPTALMSDTCVESSDPLFSYSSYDNDTFDCDYNKENDTKCWEGSLFDHQPEKIKDKPCKNTIVTRSQTSYKRPRLSYQMLVRAII